MATLNWLKLNMLFLSGLTALLLFHPGFGHILNASELDDDIVVAEEQSPVPIGGFKAIKKHLKYPEYAKQNKLAGSLIVGVLIDENGNPIATKIRDRKGFAGFEIAAKEALMAVKWQPAKQGDQPVKVWVWIPIHFNCHSR